MCQSVTLNLDNMKNVNILSIIEGYRKLSSELFHKLMDSYGVIVDNLKGIKDYELNGIEAFLKNLRETGDATFVFNNYYLGYSIPQIGKEFDLLRFGNNYIINIEIKSESSADKILKQQEKNKYYLSFLGKEIHIYTYVQNENKLYKLIIGNSGNTTREVAFAELFSKLSDQEIANIVNINDLFNPSDYLISPFNSTEKFTNGGYFLTGQQDKIYKDIQKQLLDNTTNFVALTGGAGTGKTLLTYHVAKEFIDAGKKVLILHCAQLNNGHRTLNDEWNWHICMPKYSPDIEEYDLIIIDEAQRMYPIQFERLKNEIINSNKKCIFSYDEKQYLSNGERTYNIKEKVETELFCKPHKLTTKIRTNKEKASFIKQLFDLKQNIHDTEYPNIELIYCSNNSSAQRLLQNLSNNGWKVPNYTPGTRSAFHYEQYRSEDHESAHSVIGQEFDNIVVVIDNCFIYDSSGQLTANNRYYSQRQMLYQIITRTRKKLCVVVIDNETMLNRCIEILNR